MPRSHVILRAALRLPPTMWSLVAGVLVCLIGLTFSSCAPSQRVTQREVLPATASISREPTIRVRIAADQKTVVLTSNASITLGPTPAHNQLAQPRNFPQPVYIAHRDGAFVITDSARRALAWKLPSLMATAPDPTGIGLEGAAYPGSLVLVPSEQVTGSWNTIDVVNHIRLEDYLPGVLDKELFAQWSPAAYRAQAIAARSYALCHMRPNRDFDVESTQASQAYSGLSTRSKSLDAVSRTRGMVLAWQGKIVPAYFSSTTGGTGQDAAIAFPNAVDIPPLRGREQGVWGRLSPNFRWGPISVDRAALTSRIAAWGRSNRDPVANLQLISQVSVARVNSVGRPAGFEIVDVSGRHFTLGPEEFRFACNTGAPRDQTLLSSHVQVRVAGGVVQFWDGRGYGHGVGMDQFGSENMARGGYSEASILAFYYPGAQIVRLY